MVQVQFSTGERMVQVEMVQIQAGSGTRWFRYKMVQVQDGHSMPYAVYWNTLRTSLNAGATSSLNPSHAPSIGHATH